MRGCLIIISFLFFSHFAIGQKIFPGAEGYGTETRAAYAGSSNPTIFIVDDLRAGYYSTGTNRGTFLWCISQEGPKIIVFEVGGVIDFSGVREVVKFSFPYMTIYGQTAPYPGITIKGAHISVESHDMLIQHIKFRTGDAIEGLEPNARDCISIFTGYNIVIDHCSFSWAIDELIEINKRSEGNITISNNIIAEPLYRSYHFDGDVPGAHSYSLITYFGDVTIKNNLFAYSFGRNPLLRPGNKIVINNFTYACRWAGIMVEDYEDTDLFASVVGNVVKPMANHKLNMANTDYAVYIVNLHNSTSRLYVADNVCNMSLQNPGLSEWEKVYKNDRIPQAASSPLDLSGYTILPSSKVEDYVCENAGAYNWQRDYIDSRIVNNVINEQGDLIDSPFGSPAMASKLDDLAGSLGGNMINGYNWASNNQSFTLNGNLITLTASCNNINEVVNHVNTLLPNGYECYRTNGYTDLAYVGIRSTSIGSSQVMQLSGNALSTLGIPEGLYRGVDRIGYDLESTNHQLNIPANPHTDSDNNGYTNLEEWVYELANSDTPVPPPPPPPVNNPPLISPQTYNIIDTIALSTLIGKVQASDPDNDNISYTIQSGNSSNRYSINTSNGNLYLNNDINISTDATDNLTVRVTDNGQNNLYSNASVIIYINHYLPPAINHEPVVNDDIFYITENDLQAGFIGQIQASDQDAGQILNYMIVEGNDNLIFNINPDNGDLFFNDPEVLNFYKRQAYSILVEVADNEDASATGTIEIILLSNTSVMYIDPENISDPDEDGSYDHPFDSWNDIMWAENYTYLQRRGTIANDNKINITADHIVLGAYGEGNLPEIRTNSDECVIRLFERENVVIKDLIINASDAVSCLYILGESSDNIIVENCILQNAGNGIRIIEGEKITIQYNEFKNNEDAIYSFAETTNIHYNVFRDNKTGINITSTLSETFIYNNLFYNNSKGISNSYSDITLYNNIFYLYNNGDMAIIHQDGELVSDNNIYFPDLNGFIEFKNKIYSSLTEFQNLTDKDENSTNKNPMFMDVEKGLFTTLPGSPAIDAGYNAGLNKDFEGKNVPFGRAPDIGIIESIRNSVTSDHSIQFNNNGDNINDIIKVYPNPSPGIFCISSDEFKTDRIEILIEDVSGNAIYYEENMINNNSFKTEVDISHLSKGIYFISVIDGKDKISKKIILY